MAGEIKVNSLNLGNTAFALTKNQMIDIGFTELGDEEIQPILDSIPYNCYELDELDQDIFFDRMKETIGHLYPVVEGHQIPNSSLTDLGTCRNYLKNYFSASPVNRDFQIAMKMMLEDFHGYASELPVLTKIFDLLGLDLKLNPQEKNKRVITDRIHNRYTSFQKQLGTKLESINEKFISKLRAFYENMA